ncbi:hypothetical protein C8P63_101207 [Melghirimyces profundicolus]|uniref:Probable queuosine precursor transporter n=1 Tax=Melghirimyces profundicolus TaxID=1242148 RepID=A0A2T6C9H8_9BACL|nr:queuosine precursor transporter [Melghirimyces profundicolus]PTX64985.1 hypothetical protein C8P63_101207 [Melghirimyces profundicolus]
MNREDRWFLMFAGTFVGLLVIGNVLAVKIVQVPLFGGTYFVPAAVLVYALTFVCTDVVAEIWGRERTNWLVFVGFVTSLLVAILVQLAVWWPAAPFWKGQEAYATVLGANLRVTVAGMLAYLVSQYHDIWAFHFWKEKTGSRHLWLRNNLSTAVSQLVDTILFITIAFYGVIPDLAGVIMGQYLVKLLIALIDTPLVYGGVWLIRKRLSEDNPFRSEGGKASWAK